VFFLFINGFPYTVSYFLFALSYFLFTLSCFPIWGSYDSYYFWGVSGICSPDFFVGGFGGAFLPHAEIKGNSNIETTHIKTRLFLRIFFITQSIY
jgi:hypothetical protein